MIEKVSRNLVRERRHARVREKVCGTALRPRLSVFRSNKHIEAQVIDDSCRKTLVSCSSTQLHLANGVNVEAAAKVGSVLAEKCKAANIEEVVFDRGGYSYHGRVKALADAAREGGLRF